MTDDEYQAMAEGRAPLLDAVQTSTRVIREQVAASDYLRRPEQKFDRAMMALGALLAWVPEADKAELFELVRGGGEEIQDLLPDGRPAGMLGGPFVGSDDPAQRFAE